MKKANVKEITEKLRVILNRNEDYSDNCARMSSKLGALTYWIEQLESEIL